MGFHENASRCSTSKRAASACNAMGVQGTQNGGIDALVTCTVPGGMRELMAENLIAVWSTPSGASATTRATE